MFEVPRVVVMVAVDIGSVGEQVGGEQRGGGGGGGGAG